MLFSCLSNKNAFIDSCLTRPAVGEGLVWNLTFIRDFNDWEVEEVIAFFTFIHSKTPVNDDQDAMRWKIRHHGNFDAKSFYYSLAGKNDIKFHWKAIWKVKAPRRVSFFMWFAA